VGARLSRVRSRFRGRLITRGVSTGTTGLWAEVFPPPSRILLLLLLLETQQDMFSVGSVNTVCRPLDKPELKTGSTRLFLVRSLLLSHFVKLVKLPGTKLGELGHKNPEVSAETGADSHKQS